VQILSGFWTRISTKVYHRGAGVKDTLSEYYVASRSAVHKLAELDSTDASTRTVLAIYICLRARQLMRPRRPYGRWMLNRYPRGVVSRRLMESQTIVGSNAFD
jgi:hypothetical protein